MDLTKIIGINKLLDRFRRDVSDVFDYNFKTISPSDFELSFIFTAKSRVLKSVFDEVKKVLVRKDNKFNKLYSSNSDLIQKFEIPEQLNNKVHTSILKQIKDIEKEVFKDGIKVLRTQVDKCYFINDGEKTEIHIKIGGMYAK